MKKKIFSIFSGIAIIAVLVLNVSLGFDNNQIVNISLRTLQKAQAIDGGECVTTAPSGSGYKVKIGEACPTPCENYTSQTCVYGSTGCTRITCI